jgi:ribose/xylose/arabinose/galactoside ABC-type transport system permease subunit
VGVLAPLAGLALIVGVGGLVQYLLEGHVRYLSPQNQATILVQSVTVAIAAVGMTVIIISGGIDLSVGSVVALTAVAAAWVVRASAPESARLAGAEALYVPVLALVAAVAVGGAAGAVNGCVITGLRLPPFIATLGMMALARGTAKWLGANQKIDAPLNWLSGFTEKNLPLFEWDWAALGWRGPVAISPAVLVTLAVAAGAVVVLRYMRFGRHVFAIGSNEATARLCGIRVERTKVRIYTAAGMLFGLAGATNFGINAIGSPTTARGMELDVIAAVVIGGGSLAGGSGTILGTLVGALLMAQLRNFCVLVGWPNYVQDMVVGAIIIAAVALDRLRHRRTA